MLANLMWKIQLYFLAEDEWKRRIFTYSVCLSHCQNPKLWFQRNDSGVHEIHRQRLLISVSSSHRSFVTRLTTIGVDKSPTFGNILLLPLVAKGTTATIHPLYGFHVTSLSVTVGYVQQDFVWLESRAAMFNHSWRKASSPIGKDGKEGIGGGCHREGSNL